MKACDRHARTEGSLKGAPKRFVLLNEDKRDEFGNPEVMLEHQLCNSCVVEFSEWYRTSHPETALAFAELELTDDEKVKFEELEREVRRGVEK